MMNQKPVCYAPCNRCAEFLAACMPLVLNGFIYGECDNFSYCEFCGYYAECTTPGLAFSQSEQEQQKGVVDFENIEL